MLSPDHRVQPNVRDVAAKVIDGEAIIMNLSNGLYFSMLDVGAAVWELVERGHSLEEMTDILATRYAIDRGTIERDVSQLVEELSQEKLVRVVDDGPVEESLPAGPGGELSYSTPRLSKYTDMADILALDPPMPGLGESTWEG